MDAEASVVICAVSEILSWNFRLQIECFAALSEQMQM